MAKVKKICINCGAEYSQCPSCEETYSKIYFAWRTKYCTPKCMMEDMGKILEGDKKMRIEYNKKTYTLKSYDLDKDTYVLPDGTKLKAKDISCFLTPSEEFVKIIKHTPKTSNGSKKTTKTEEV